MKSKRTVKVPKKPKGIKLPEYEFGTYVENPNTSLMENQIALVKAKEKASNNGWVKGLNIFGNLAMQYGTSMMNSPGATSTTPSGDAASTEGFAGAINGFTGKNSGMFNSLVQGAGMAGQASGPTYAMGGKVGIPTPINAEGKEVIETPNGQVSELSGPSHANGGIDIVVPSGTEIFSERLKGPNGKSMAERKIAREKKINKVDKVLEINPTDAILKKTLERTKANNSKEEEQDMMKMQFAKMMSDMSQHFGLGGIVGEYGDGGVVPDPRRFEKIQYARGYGLNQFQPFLTQYEGSDVNTNPNWGDVENRKAFQTKIGTKPDGIFGPDTLAKANAYYQANPSAQSGVGTGSATGGNPNIDYGKISQTMSDLPISDDARLGDVTNRPYSATPGINDGNTGTGDTGDGTGGFDWLGNLMGGKNGGLTSGDMVGLFGQLYSTFKPMKNTRANRAGDTPNINAFKDYGKDALNKMDQSKQYVNQVRDEQNKDLELSRTGAIKRNRNSARGINTMRALDLATDANANNTKSQIYQQFSQAMQQIYGQEATLENDQDAKVMQGEYARDLADRQDRDNYFSQMAQDIATKGTGLQHIGKSMNDVKTRTVTGNVMDSLFPDFDMSGMDGKMKKTVNKTASQNAEFLKSIPDKNVRNTVLTKVSTGEWYTKGNKVYDKASNQEINLTRN